MAPDDERPVTREGDRAERFPLGSRVTIPALSDDPYPIFHELRTHEPVTWVPELNMWLLTRRDDVADVLGDSVRFTTDSAVSTIQDVFGRQMLSSDGEDWIRYKRACMPPFRREELETSLRGTVDAVVDEILEGLAGRTTADLRAELSAPLSLRSVLRVLGFPMEDQDRFRGWYDDFAEALANFTGDPAVRDRGHGSAAEFRSYVDDLLAGGYAAPAHSLLDVLTSGNGELSPGEIVSNLLIVLFGGVETADSMIAGCIWSILAHAGTKNRLVADRSVLPSVIEEALRWDAPVQSCTRFTTEEVEIRGVVIPAGETVQCMLGAANRDPDHFAHPDRFDPDRLDASEHLSFGAGRHFCLGSVMARMEAETAVTRVLDAFPDLTLIDREEARPRGHEFRRPRELWVRLG